MSSVPTSAARLILTVAALLGILGAGISFAGTDVGSVHFTLGNKRLSNEWFVGVPEASAAGDTVISKASQPALGVELTWGRAGWPVLIALDVLHSYDDGQERYPAISLGSLVIPVADVRRRASTFEVGLGLRRSLRVLGLNPYIGAGGSWVRANVIYQMSDPSAATYGTTGPSVHNFDGGFGYWGGGGLYCHLGPRFQLGLTARHSKAKLRIPDVKVVGEQGGYRFIPGDRTEVEAGGTHIGVIAGWSFPARK